MPIEEMNKQNVIAYVLILITFSLSCFVIISKEKEMNDAKATWKTNNTEIKFIKKEANIGNWATGVRLPKDAQERIDILEKENKRLKSIWDMKMKEGGGSSWDLKSYISKWKKQYNSLLERYEIESAKIDKMKKVYKGE